jgi:predicted TIM-barrel fold metal-dependent hydrolase
MLPMRAASYPNPPVRPGWLSLLAEEVLDPGQPIIDPHHHLWNAGGQHGADAYLLEELLADIGDGHRILATVYAQAGWKLAAGGPAAFRPVGETIAAREVGMASDTVRGRPRVCAGIVSYADLRLSELPAVLDAHAAAGASRFRGIRQSAALDGAIVPMTTVPPPSGLLLQPDFQKGLRLLGARGLTFDAWVYHPQLDELLHAARAAPETKIVIDHTGGPLRCGPFAAKAEEEWHCWLDGMTALAQCPNVYVKLGGLGMTISGFGFDAAPEPPSSQQLAEAWRVWFDPCIQHFGPHRCMFESNFPVDKGMFSYCVLWNAFKRIAMPLSSTEKAALFHDTAARFYSLAPA